MSTPKTSPGPRRQGHFVAVYPNATQAGQFEANATRTTGATNVVRKGCTVEFDADTEWSDGDSKVSDIALSVGFYGGPGTTLNGVIVPREM